MLVTEHVWRTQDGRYVPPGHADAAFLAHATGDEVADREADRIGLADYLKSRATPENKMVARPSDKGRTAPGGK